MGKKKVETSKDQLFLEVVSNLVKFYSVMGHCLRFITEEDISDQMPLEEVKGHFRKTREALMPRLDRNPVVRGKVENDYGMTLKLLEGFGDRGMDEAEREGKKEEALRRFFYAREKAASMSDIVGVFRSL